MTLDPAAVIEEGRDPNIPVAGMAHRLRIDQSTRFRCFPGGRAGLADRRDTA